MTPLTATFSGRPDVLDLIVTAEASAEVSIEAMLPAFGQSEARAFCYRGIPLGVVGDLMPYHKSLGSFSDKNVLVILAPALRSSTPFPQISPESFREALSQFLSSERADWTLICERDCDQDSIVHLQSSSREAQNQLAELFQFVEGRPGVGCPTFVITKANREVFFHLRQCSDSDSERIVAASTQAATGSSNSVISSP